MKKHVTLFSFIFIFFSSFAQTIKWEANNDVVEIGDKISILEDPSGKLTFEQVSLAKYDTSFKLSKHKNLNFEYSLSLFWLKFEMNNTTSENLILDIEQAGLPITELYYKTDSGKIVKINAGYKTPMSEKIIKSSHQAFHLPPGNRYYYVRLSNNSIPIPIRIFKESTYEENSNTKKLIYGFYLGLMFFVMLNNLFLSFTLRNRMYLFYSFIVILYASYGAIVLDGFIVYFSSQIDLFFWFTTIPTMGVTIQTIYCLYFLEVKKYNPKLFKIVWGIIIYFGLWAILKFWFTLPIVQPINILNALTSFFLMGFIGIKVGKRGNKLGYYFALAYFIYFLLVLVEATYVTTGSPAYLAGLSHTAWATIIEAFLLSFLLSKRFEWEQREMEKSKSEAQLLLLEKTVENEKIVREQNVILEQKVEERTHQLKETNEELSHTLEVVEKEKQKSEDLLHNILPEEIAEELKLSGSSHARQFESVSVMFTDFVNFTGISEKLAPQELVEEIDLCYKAFDEIIDRNELEKIKTIGDAYLAVCGLPKIDKEHAFKVVNAALEIMNFVNERKKNTGLFDLRIGINSGTVVAGIVGIKKFSYDIWGDTVNTAHRMESNSETGRINISGSTYELVKDDFEFEYRGKIQAKGKGEVKMYFVIGPKV